MSSTEDMLEKRYLLLLEWARLLDGGMSPSDRARVDEIEEAVADIDAQLGARRATAAE